MSTPDVLYLFHRVPFPPDKGDRIRNWNLLRFLARKSRVWTACLADEPVAAETEHVLKDICARVTIIPSGSIRWIRGAVSLIGGRSISEGIFSSPGLRKTIRAWTRETTFRTAIVSAGSLAPYLQMPELQGVPGVIDLVDVDSQKWFDYAETAPWPRSVLYRTEGNRLRKFEREFPGWAKAVTLVSEAERELYLRFARSGRVEAVTNGTDLDYFRPMEKPEELACVFVGALDYRPNVDAACWFVDRVWEQIRSRHPNLSFRLVGRQPTTAVRKLGSVPGVHLIGGVPDVRPWLATATMAVVPLRIARGVQNKVLEAMAMGKPCIASPAALAGIPARPEEHFLSASTPADWVTAVDRLMNDAELRQRLGRAGRAYVQTHHTWEQCLAPLDSIVFDS